MKTRRRLGVSAAGVGMGVTMLLAWLPGPSANAQHPVAPPRPLDRAAATALAQLAIPPLPTTTTTTPPPPSAPRCPVDGAVSFVDSFGAPRRGHRHEGVDMMAAYGTPVVAPVDGVVVDRGNPAGGLSFHLLAADGTDYYGTHLSSYAATGQVTAGTVLGYVGETGNAQSAHLHFEIHPGGEAAPAINPTPIVATWCAVTL